MLPADCAKYFVVKSNQTSPESVWRETISPKSTRIVGHKRLVTVFAHELGAKSEKPKRDEEVEKRNQAEIRSQAEHEWRRSQGVKLPEERALNCLERRFMPVEVQENSPADKVPPSKAPN